MRSQISDAMAWEYFDGLLMLRNIQHHKPLFQRNLQTPYRLTPLTAPSPLWPNPSMDTDWLRDQLEKSGNTQASLARVLGLNRSQMTRLIQGVRSLQISEIATVARHLDCHPVEVLKACGLDLSEWRR